MVWFRVGAHRIAWALLLCACDEAEPPTVGPCELLAKERAACDASVQACEGELDECNAACLLGLGCVDLLDPANEPGAIACKARCAPKFTCDDGSQIRREWVCDKREDCAQGEDEKQCP